MGYSRVSSSAVTVSPVVVVVAENSSTTAWWRVSGRPLTSHQAVVELISATTTTTGLTVTAELDTGEDPTGLRYTSKQVDALPIGKHDFHPDWNYTIRPEPHETPVPSRKQTTRPVKHQ